MTCGFKSHLPHQNKERRDGVSALFVFVCSLDLFVALLFVPAAGTAKAKRPGCPDSRGVCSFLYQRRGDRLSFSAAR